jgi:16S rRNA processing protein RimM
LKNLVPVGRIVGAHGVRGEVKLVSFTAEPEAIGTYAPLETAKGAMIEIAKLRPGKDGFIAALKGITTRNAAEVLMGTALFVARERLPELAEGEVYVHDLIGRPVELADGRVLGEVSGIENYGAGDLIDVRIDGRKNGVLVPFAPDYVLRADREKVVVDLPVGYLDEGERT